MVVFHPALTHRPTAMLRVPNIHLDLPGTQVACNTHSPRGSARRLAIQQPSIKRATTSRGPTCLVSPRALAMSLRDNISWNHTNRARCGGRSTHVFSIPIGRPPSATIWQEQGQPIPAKSYTRDLRRFIRVPLSARR